MKTLLQTTLLSVLLITYLIVSSYAQSGPDSARPSGTDTIIFKTDSIPNETLVPVLNSATEEILTPKKSHFEAGISYQSNNVYLGRKDSTVLPYYIPEFTYYHKSGLYVTTSFNYLKNSTASRIDLFTLEGGYTFSTGDYEGQFAASKYFYSSQSNSITSELKASLDYQNSFDLGFIKPLMEVTLNIGSKLDFATQLGVEHRFYLLDDKLDITPTFIANGSTQNYYNDYYKKRRYTIKSKIQPPQTGIASITGTVIDASTFKILDFEPSLPINYRIGKCNINFTPTYAIPVHPAIVEVQSVRQNGTVINRTRTESIENSFYCTVGVTFLF